MTYRRRHFDEKHLHTSPEDPDGRVDVRKSDYSRWWKAFENMQKYAVAYAMGAAIFTTFGFSVITPKRTQAEISGKFDTTLVEVDRKLVHLQAEIDTGAAQRTIMQKQLDGLESEFGILIRMACQDKFTTKEQKVLVGLVDNHGDCIK
jgi:hypothetical protein